MKIGGLARVAVMHVGDDVAQFVEEDQQDEADRKIRSRSCIGKGRC